MKILVDFDALVTFDCIYGASKDEGGELRVFVEKGLSFNFSKIVPLGDNLKIERCSKEESENFGGIFPYHYIYDAARGAEYVRWEIRDGLLNAYKSSGEFVKYESRVDSLYAMYELVGGCWFVFEDVVFAKRSVTSDYEDNAAGGSKKDVLSFGEVAALRDESKSFLLEGVLNVFPGPGWVIWEIFAKSFHIEIVGHDFNLNDIKKRMR